MAASPTIRLCSIDDHEIVHTGLTFMAQSQPDFTFVGALSNPTDTLAFVQDCRPDIVMLDLFMQEEQGWSTCQQLVTEAPGVHVVMYSGYGNSELVERALHLGAAGYLLKSTGVNELPDLLRGVLTTGQCIDPALLADWRRMRSRPRNTHAISDQELAIIRLIATGCDNYAIGEELNISFHTAKFHIAKLLRRTGEPNRAGLVRWAKERFLID